MMDCIKSNKVPEAVKFTANMQAVLKDAKLHLHAAAARMKAYADSSRKEVVLTVGQKVTLSTKNLKPKYGTRKLMPRYIGPFTVLKQINDVAYKIDVPSNLKIHKVFHVSLLSPYNDKGDRRPPPPVFVNDEPEWEVEAVLLHRVSRRFKHKAKLLPSETPVPVNQHDYYIKWAGYGPEHCSWEPFKNLTNCDSVLQAYWKYHSDITGDARESKRRKL
jgi:hypothetical protein